MINRILHLERKFTTATETFIVNQINALDYSEHHVFTIEFLNTLIANATIHYPTKGGFLSDKVLSTKHRRYFQAQFAQIYPKVIHSHYITDAVVFRPLTKKVSIPKICSCYGYDVSVIPVKFKYIYKSFYRKIFAEYDLFLAMTDEMKKDLLEIGCPEKKIQIHYHGIDTQKFNLTREYSLTDDKINLLTVASLYEVKGHLSVLQALVYILKKYPKIQFTYTIIGEGPLKTFLSDYVHENGLIKIVNFLGAIQHGAEFKEKLLQADIFLHPSVTTKDNDKEGIPGALVEAMASGLPSIATFHGGIPSVVSHGVTGLLVKEHDSRAIAENIVALYKSKTLRSTIGTKARVYAKENLDVFEKAKDLMSIYESLVRKNRNKTKDRASNGWQKPS